MVPLLLYPLKILIRLRNNPFYYSKKTSKIQESGIIKYNIYCNCNPSLLL